MITNEHLLGALKELVSDIEAMQSGTDPDWFGDFSESQDLDDGKVAIEWPNLAISVQKAQAIVAEYEAANPPAGTTCSVCGKPQFETVHGTTCENGHGGAPASDIRIHGSERDLDWNKPTPPVITGQNG